MKANNRTWRILMPCTILLIIYLCGIPNQLHSQDYDRVRFIGTLYAPDAVPQGVQGLRGVHLIIEEKEAWVLALEETRDLTSGETREEQIPRQFIPPRLLLRGDQDVLGFLQNPDLAGKRLMIQGYVDGAQNLLTVQKAEVLAGGQPRYAPEN